MHPILKLVVQRIALGLVLLLAVSLLIFAGTEALPGDVAQSILGQSATPEALANLREALGLNEPALTRYFKWLGGILTGDFGVALTNGQDIGQAIGQRLGNTLFLASAAAMISVPLAILLGLVAGMVLLFGRYWWQLVQLYVGHDGIRWAVALAACMLASRLCRRWLRRPAPTMADALHRHA